MEYPILLLSACCLLYSAQAQTPTEKALRARVAKLEKQIRQDSRDIVTLGKSCYYAVRAGMETQIKLDSLISEMKTATDAMPNVILDQEPVIRGNESGEIINLPEADSSGWYHWRRDQILETPLMAWHFDTLQVVRFVSNTTKSNFWRHVDHALYAVPLYLCPDGTFLDEHKRPLKPWIKVWPNL